MNTSLIRRLMEEREWSWPAIGIVTILVGLVLRSFFLSRILRQIKASNRQWYKRTQTYYEGRALLGWIFFGLFVGGSMLLWRFESFFLKYLDVWLCWIILGTCLVISLLLHICAYAQSMVDAIRDQGVLDKEH
ncbi:MAG: hypothetical protein A3G87_02480 [Omnitrophica bacterium RIFCSPLOWO2_12_FULL_50_11]|nr:MAG: hypothetical protein A3G87_02480 [Omnitrophica bacterium RIFCSPLOWO2_12_FULL_50_11]